MVNPYFCRMQDLEFWGAFGDIKLRVKVIRPHGGGSIQILVNNYLQGLMDKVNGTWLARVPPNGLLTSTDILILGDLIDGLGNTS